MTYHFDSKVAEQYGVDEAIMIVNFQFWIAKNKANKNHHHDGRTWTYNTYDAFAELFRFWSPKQIRRVLDSLEQSKVIITGNYGDHWSDQTKWYAFNDESVWLKDFEPNGQMQLPKRADDSCPNGQLTVAQTGRCTGTDVLPDVLPVPPTPSPSPEHIPTCRLPVVLQTKTTQPPNDEKNASAREPSPKEVIKMVDQFWQEYPRKSNRMDTEHAFSEVKAWLFMPQILSALKWQKRSEQWLRENGRYIPMPSAYLRDMRWQDEPIKPVSNTPQWTHDQILAYAQS